MVLGFYNVLGQEKAVEIGHMRTLSHVALIDINFVSCFVIFILQDVKSEAQRRSLTCSGLRSWSSRAETDRSLYFSSGALCIRGRSSDNCLLMGELGCF